MVHVFVPSARQYYDLEHLWEDSELTEIPNLDEHAKHETERFKK